MRGSSSMFGPSLAGSHTVSSTVDAFYAGTLVLDNVPISDGSLELDSTQMIAANLGFTVPRYFTPPDGVTRDLLPSGELDAFANNGQRVLLAYTISRPGHGTETINLGWYRINDWTEDGASLNVTATSLEALLDEFRFLDTIQIAAGTGFQAAVRQINANTLPLRFAPGVTGTVLGRSAEDNRLEALATLVTDWGYRLYVNDAGTLVVAPAWDDTTDPSIASLVDGEGGTVVRVPTQGNRDGVYNAVRASGETDGDVAPVAATEYLNTGPRRWNGPYGNVPYFYSSPLLSTTSQARTAARTRLRNLQAIANPVTIDAVPDPRYELGDLLTLTHEQADRLVRVDAITLPLTAGGGAMTIRGHEVRR